MPCANPDRIELGDASIADPVGVPADSPGTGTIIHCDDSWSFAGQCIDSVAVVDPAREPADAPDTYYSDPPPPTIYSCDSAPNSFVPGTRVLMADGTTKAIEDVKIGDQVIAADPTTGRSSAEPVTALIEGQGPKNLVKITVDVDGSAGTATDTITATDNHPFWVPVLRQWIDAGRLQPGMWLQTSAGTYVQVAAAQTWTAVQRVHNLTVADLHTYYAVAGSTAVLVHNDNSCGPAKGSARPDDETVFAGHGGRSFGDGWTKVPQGTSLAVYGKKGRTITDFTGFRVEVGDPDLKPTKVYGPGSRVRNLQLYPPTPDLAIHSRSTTVRSQTPLSELLKPNMGTCHWAACQGSREP
ncbi:hypothetical protein GCM10022224_072240 [Nonomuraea antimicrobica]|uniref:Hint domain-containing protein n=1 Tax=Nonomuraea antimicrobica TaxID=561173 RepID=A0ABP7CTI9_9ACTN